MREDMAKVLTESPRTKAYTKSPKKRLRDPNGPSVQSMRGAHRNRKEFGEHLKPLMRWFDSQVGRPWSKVYSELREHVDARGATQLHILQHAEMYAETSTA